MTTHLNFLKYLFSKKTLNVSGCLIVLELLLKDHLLNLAFLLTWYCRIARIWRGRGRGKCILFVGMLLVILTGCVFFLLSFEQTNRKTQTYDCAKKGKKTHQSLATDLTKNFRELGANWEKYVYFIAPRSLIGNKLGTLSCSLLHQRL